MLHMSHGDLETSKSDAQVPTSKRYAAPVKHDDVIIVPEFFCKETFLLFGSLHQEQFKAWFESSVCS